MTTKLLKRTQIYYSSVGSEVFLSSHCVKIKVSAAGLYSFLGALEEDLFPCLFHLLEAACIL